MSLGINEVFASDRWLNVQEPIIDVLKSLTKAIQTQSYDLVNLDQATKTLSSQQSSFEAVFYETLGDTVTKEDGDRLLNALDQRASKRDLDKVENKLTDVSSSSMNPSLSLMNY